MKDFVQNINHQFYAFVSKYDLTDDNIIRKIVHTNTVADTCFLIACEMGLNQNDRELAYLSGILHDIGRFEQWKLYKTYNDHKSVDHGDLSYDLSFKFDLSMVNEEDRENVRLAVKYHTKQYTGSNKRIKLFNRIILCADAYANVLNTANGAQRMTVNKEGVTNEILNDFKMQKGLWKYSPETKVDRALMLTACTYYVRLDFLKRQIANANLIDVIAENFAQYLNDDDKKVYFDAVNFLKLHYFDENLSGNLDGLQ